MQRSSDRQTQHTGNSATTMHNQLTKKLCLELQKGKFCYVTGPRAIDRPTLCQHTCIEMAQQGYRNVVVTIRKLKNTAESQTNWDQHIISTLWSHLHPNGSRQLARWLKTTAHLPPKERLMQFASDLLLSDLCEGPFLICLNNIDGLTTIPNAVQDVIDWITYCYELRDTYLTYRHLSVVIFGSSKPIPTKPGTSRFDTGQPVFFQAPPYLPLRQLASPSNFRGILSAVA